MEAGPQLDLLVHEQVMKLPITDEMRVLAEEGMSGYVLNAPAYSTDIAAAWRVVEKLQSLRRYCLLAETEDHKWEACFMTSVSNGDPYTSTEAVHQSVSVAICNAALAAIG